MMHYGIWSAPSVSCSTTDAALRTSVHLLCGSPPLMTSASGGCSPTASRRTQMERQAALKIRWNKKSVYIYIYRLQAYIFIFFQTLYLIFKYRFIYILYIFLNIFVYRPIFFFIKIYIFYFLNIFVYFQCILHIYI